MVVDAGDAAINHVGLSAIINFFLVTGARGTRGAALRRYHRISGLDRLSLWRPHVHMIIEHDIKPHSFNNVYNITIVLINIISIEIPSFSSVSLDCIIA